MYLQVLAKCLCHQVDQMETVAQGRVWSGQDAFSRGLIDSVGGLSQALAIAKQKANIPRDKKVCSTIKTVYFDFRSSFYVACIYVHLFFFLVFNYFTC